MDRVEEFERTCRAGRRADLAGDRATAERHFEAAVQLYQGDFLADEPYAEWAAAIRDALRQQAIEMQSRLVEMYADRGDHGPAASWRAGSSRSTRATNACTGG